MAWPEGDSLPAGWSINGAHWQINTLEYRSAPSSLAIVRYTFGWREFYTSALTFSGGSEEVVFWYKFVKPSADSYLSANLYPLDLSSPVATAWVDTNSDGWQSIRLSPGAPGSYILRIRALVKATGSGGLWLDDFEFPGAALVGNTSLPVALWFGAVGNASLPITWSTGPVSAPSLSVTIDVLPASVFGGDAPLSTSTDIEVAPGYGGQLSAVWRWVVMLNGEDVADSLVGEVVVEFEEGAARLAMFGVALEPGRSINLVSWTGMSVEIDFAGRATDGSAIHPIRLFTGVVDIPDYDPRNRIISLTCTDDIQGAVDSMTDAQIDKLAGGRWSHVVFDPASSRGWQRMQDVLSTTPACVDMDPWRSLRRTPWQAAPVPHLVFTDDEVGDDSVSVSLANRGSLTNHVAIEFTYRYPRLKAIGYPIVYRLVGTNEIDAFTRAGNWFLTRSAVQSALAAAGVTVIGEIDYEPLPDHAVGMWVPGPVDDQLCIGFSAACSFDYGQMIDEVHKVTVMAPVSVGQVGLRSTSMRTSLAAEFQPVGTWEERSWSAKSGANTALIAAQSVTAEAGKFVQVNADPMLGTDRAAADAAMSTLIDMAKTRVLGTHRANSLRAVVPLNPAIDTDKTIEINAEGHHARGKVRAGRHIGDPATGRAVTEFELAIASCAGAGFIHPSTPTAPPSGDTPGIRDHDVSPVVTFDPSPESDHVLSIEFPGIEEVERNNAIVEITSTYNAGLVEDLFTINT